MFSQRNSMIAGLVFVFLAGVALAQPADRPPRPRDDQGGPPRERGGRMMGQWLDDLAAAHEQKDLDKIGQLIEQMKERRERFAGGRAQPGQDRPQPRGQGAQDRPQPQGAAAAPPAPADRVQRGPVIEEKAPLGKSETEKKMLAVLNDLYQNQRRGMMNVPPEDGRLLRLLAETTNAQNVVELGTSNGYSGIWWCLALNTTGGKLTTFDINEERAALARENFVRAGVTDRVTQIMGDAHETVSQLKDPIDILFIDADKEGYIDYLNKLLPLVKPGGLVIAHNMTPRMADPRFVEAITTNPDLETLFLHKDGGGVGVTLKKRSMK